MFNRTLYRLFPVLPALILCVSAHAGPGQDTPEFQRAVEILESAPLIDGHNDVPWQYLERTGNRLDDIDLAADTSGLEPAMHTDIPRLRDGRVGAQFWSVFVPTDITGAEAVKAQLEQIDIAHRMIDRYEVFELVTTADGVERAFAAGRIASLLCMEGGHTLDNSLAALRMFHELGVSYLTLTHWEPHDWADAATDAPRHGGLTDFGREIVREMNRLGMLVDLSHVHDRVMHDALDVTAAPVIFSHSSVRAITDHPRNVPDDVLDRLPDNGGVVMVTFVPAFIRDEVRHWHAAEEGEQARLAALFPGDSERVEAGIEAWRTANPRPVARLEDVADHIDYIKGRIGSDHIGIGGDFDGITTVPMGLEDVSAYPALFAELIRRGYAEDELVAIAGGNVLRVMREAEAVSARLRAEREASDVKFEDFVVDDRETPETESRAWDRL